MKHWVQYHDPDTRGRVAEEVSPMMTTIGGKIQEPAGRARIIRLIFGPKILFGGTIACKLVANRKSLFAF
jgi:hypothetical protein